MSKRTEISLIFGIIFLISWGFICYLLGSFLKFDHTLLPLNYVQLEQLSLIVGLLTINSLFFTVFIVLVDRFWIGLPVIFLSIPMPIILIDPPVCYILAICYYAVLLLSYYYVKYRLYSYINFNPSQMIITPIVSLVRAVILIISILYFLVISQLIKQTAITRDNLLTILPQQLASFSTMYQIVNKAQDVSVYRSIVPVLVSDKKITVAADEEVITGVFIVSLILLMLMNCIFLLISWLISPVIKLIFYALEAFNVILVIDDKKTVRRWITQINY